LFITLVVVFCAGLAGYLWRTSLDRVAVQSTGGKQNLVACVVDSYAIDSGPSDGPTRVALVDLPPSPRGSCELYHDIENKGAVPVWIFGFGVPGLTDATTGAVLNVQRRTGPTSSFPKQVSAFTPQILMPGDRLRFGVLFELDPCQGYAAGTLGTFEQLDVDYLDLPWPRRAEMSLGTRYAMRSPPDNSCPQRGAQP
jgi:hypothetical protein